METTEYRGTWTVPGADDLPPVEGVCRFQPGDGVTLEFSGFPFLDRQITPGRVPLVLNKVHLPVVHGTTDSGEHITLTNLRIQSVQISGSFATSPQTYRAEAGLVGPAHVADPFQAAFSRAHVEYNWLDHWSGTWAAFHPDVFDALRRGDDPSRYAVRYDLPMGGDVRIGTTRLRLRVAHVPYATQEGIWIDSTSRIVLNADSPLTVESWYSDYIVPVRDFLTFAAMRPSHVEKIVFVRPSEIEEVTEEYHLLHGVIRGRPNDAETTSPYSLLFIATHIETEFAMTLGEWFAFRERNRFAVDMLSSAVESVDISLATRFVLTIAALEAFHRREGAFSGNETLSVVEMPDEEFNSLVESAVSAVPPERQAWLRQRLEHRNEPSLRRRVREVVKLLRDALDWSNSQMDAVFSSGQCQQAVDTRNYLVHGVDELREKAASGRDLFDLTRRLDFVIRMCWLLTMGASEETIRKIVCDYRSHRGF